MIRKNQAKVSELKEHPSQHYLQQDIANIGLGLLLEMLNMWKPLKKLGNYGNRVFKKISLIINEKIKINSYW